MSEIRKYNKDIEGQVNVENIVNSIRNIIKLIFSNLKYPIIGSLILGAVMFYISYKHSTKYVAEFTFMVNEDESSKFSGGLAANILGRIGVGGASKFNLDKILDLSKSDMIMIKTLFNKIQKNNKEDYLINSFIEEYEIVDKDTKEQILFKQSERDKFSVKENKALKNVLDLLKGEKGIINTFYNDKSGIMTIAIESTNEILSLKTVEIMFNELSRYYIESSIQREKFSFDVIKARTDSLYNTINSIETSRVKTEDNTLGLWKQTDNLPVMRKNRDQTVNTLIYGEALKNLEVARFSYQTKMPYIQEIDKPFEPLEKIERNIFIYTVLGIVTGALLGVIILLITHYLKLSLR